MSQVGAAMPAPARRARSAGAPPRGASRHRWRSCLVLLAVIVASGALVSVVPAGAQPSSEQDSPATTAAPVLRCALATHSATNVRLHDNQNGDGFRLLWTHIGPMDDCSDDAGFRVDYRVSGTQAWSHADVGPDAREATVSGLAAGNYDVRLRGFNETDLGPAMTQSFERRATPCAAPEITRIEGRAGRTLYLEWTYDGASDCHELDWRLTVRRTNDHSFQTYGRNMTGTGCVAANPCSHEWTGGLGVRSYDVSIAAIRAGGLSKPSTWRTVSISVGGL